MHPRRRHDRHRAARSCAAAELLKAEGATEVWAMATHGVLSGPAIDRLKNAP